MKCIYSIDNQIQNALLEHFYSIITLPQNLNLKLLGTNELFAVMMKHNMIDNIQSTPFCTINIKIVQWNEYNTIE